MGQGKSKVTPLMALGIVGIIVGGILIANFSMTVPGWILVAVGIALAAYGGMTGK